VIATGPRPRRLIGRSGSCARSHRRHPRRPTVRDSRLPTPIIADCLDFNLRFTRGVEDVKLLVSGQDADVELRAATGPRYGRIWNKDVVDALVERFGDGVSGHWRVPGIFGRRITVDKADTTLYASDRDMFVFLADEIAAAGFDLAI